MPFVPEQETKSSRFKPDTQVSEITTPTESGGAAFGIYPKQRATPSSPETKEAVQKAAEVGADVLGFSVPEEPEMSPTAVGVSSGLGAAAGRYGPAALKKVGSLVSKIPTAPTRAAGGAMQALGTGLQSIPSTRRTLLPAAAMGGTELAGQVGEQMGVPRAATDLATLGLGPSAGRKIGETLVGTTTRTGEALAKKAEQLGFKLSPAQVRADIPVPAKGATFSSKENQKLANELASEGTGKKVKEIDSTFIGDRLKELGKEFDGVYKGKVFKIDQNAVDSIQNILREELSAIGPSGTSTVKSAADDIIKNFQSLASQSGFVPGTFAIEGEGLQRLRNALTERARSTSRSNAHEIYELVDQIDGSIARNHPQVAEKLKELRPKYRNSIILEDLYRAGGIHQGNISLEQLGNMLRGKREAVRMSGRDIDELGELGRELKLRARWETEGRAASEGEDVLGKLLGTGTDIVGKLLGTRSNTARSLQRYLSE